MADSVPPFFHFFTFFGEPFLFSSSFCNKLFAIQQLLVVRVYRSSLRVLCEEKEERLKIRYVQDVFRLGLQLWKVFFPYFRVFFHLRQCLQFCIACDCQKALKADLEPFYKGVSKSHEQVRI